MRGNYYEPKGAAKVKVMAHMTNTLKAARRLEAFLTDYAMQARDLVYDDDHNPVAVKYYPPFAVSDEDIDAAFSKLPKRPTSADLGKRLGVDWAKVVGGSVSLILVTGEKELPDHTPLTNDQLADEYGIHRHIGDCPNCGLAVSYGETECSRCGEVF